ncbi:MAG: histidine--tRNA ligase [Pseudomonadota bacterium]
MADKIQSIRGMNDILPAETVYWQFLEQHLKQLMLAYDYQEIRFPLLESTYLFKRSIGEVTDIVEKEMYTFLDRNGDSLTLRPEGTAVCVRAAIQQGMLVNQQQRLWYMGPMFRHERPQKGRYRQFHQFGVEVFGLAGPDIDVELLLLLARFWNQIGLADNICLQINSLGDSQSRETYRGVLIEYFSAYKDQLDDDSLRRLDSNPLRILDSKNPALESLIAAAPKLIDYIDDESKQDFDHLCNLLDQCQIKYEVNLRLVRGLDYYNKLVFEWVTDQLGSQGTVCAGGRYDGLVKQLNGRATPAVGFAMGMERLVSLLQDKESNPGSKPHAVLLMVGDNARNKGLSIVESLRDSLPELRLKTLCGGGSFKSLMKKADKSGASIALILADDEIAQNKISLKYLRTKENTIAQQQTLKFDQVIIELAKLITL